MTATAHARALARITYRLSPILGRPQARITCGTCGHGSRWSANPAGPHRWAHRHYPENTTCCEWIES